MIRIMLLVVSMPLAVLAEQKFCGTIQDATVIKTIPIPKDVSYFIRGSRDSGEITFATPKGNLLVNSKTGEKTKLPGNLDPILTPDGQVLGIPQRLVYNPKNGSFSKSPEKNDYDYSGWIFEGGSLMYCDRKNHKPCEKTELTRADLDNRGESYLIQVMTFYSRDSLDKPILIDKDVTHNYQSFGQLSQSADKSKYRMLFESDKGIQIRDYAYDKKTKKLETVSSIKSPCPAKMAVLPAQSKSGEEYSYYDPDKGVTQVIGMGKSGYECVVKETIPGMLGKIDFSPDGKHLAYHIDKRYDDGATNNIIGAADANNSLEAIVFDRTTKKPAIIARSENSNAYYPIFLDNKTLAYIDATKDTINLKFSLKVASLKKISTPDCPKCFEHGTEEVQLAAVVGIIRDYQCEEREREYYLKSGLSGFSNLRGSQCQDIVQSCDDKCLKDIKASINESKMVRNTTKQTWDFDKIANLKGTDLKDFCKKVAEANNKQSTSNKSEPGLR